MVVQEKQRSGVLVTLEANSRSGIAEFPERLERIPDGSWQVLELHRFTNDGPLTVWYADLVGPRSVRLSASQCFDCSYVSARGDPVEMELVALVFRVI